MSTATRDYTTGDVARLFGFATGTVGKWCNRGMIQSYKVPGSRHRRVTGDSLRAFIEKHPDLKVALNAEKRQELGL